MSIYDNKVYSNNGNPAIIQEIPQSAKVILDVGCGAGDNARIMKNQGKEVYGITISKSEAKVAKKFCKQILILDVEKKLLPYEPKFFDIIIFSHILEHLKDPTSVVESIIKYLKSDGSILIAVPNVAFYRYRLKLLFGNWQMEEYGTFDRTHLHFWSFNSVDYFLSAISNSKIIAKKPATISVPLYPFRRIFPGIACLLDKKIGKFFPNLCAWQIIIKLQRSDSNNVKEPNC